MKTMTPIAPLMIEHKLIGRVISLMAREAKRVESGGPPNPVFVDNVVDFVRVFADRYHHVKEEDILFGEVRKKALPEALARVVDELTQDHRRQRAVVQELADANAELGHGNTAVVPAMIEAMKAFVEFYSKHMAKEDQQFFPSIMGYFTEVEKQAMLEKEIAIDRILMPERFSVMVESMEDSWWD